ncbi:NAD(P)/FAD-dependent oxidoreductase [Agromyces aerolatus]|uniref:NAD(P)/FAD-dependent oxidoreductase n=1 Tax=Agromyces sp. LY-1074 TaxID=3074080 RepID=UPI002863A98F|nr:MULTISPECIES: FAD-binding oxidoreductase [unclassified Agromyces]MDR5700505.1 FAD-binding oxidoreductase [Agromyces sp. LY-1074]MDR5707026.1 FAD-binding oxidoreductase [Agromyces sp. LY-1358]
MAQRHADVVIVGGGITGCATAYHLAGADADVLLVAAGDLNIDASGRNAGSLHGQIQHPSFREFGEGWARNFLPALAMLDESLALWDGLSDELGIDLEVSRNGGLLIGETDEQMAAIARKVAIEQEAGYPSRILDRAELAEIAPWVAPDMAGAAFMPTEGKANPLLAAHAFARAAAKRGARFALGTPVSRLSRTDDGYELQVGADVIRAGSLVLAAGDGLPELGAQLGLDIPVTAEPVQVSVTQSVEPIVKHLVYYAGDKLTLKQSKSGSLLIGGGWPARQNAQGEWVVDPDSLRSNLRVALRVAPAIGSAQILRSWAGIGNATPDLVPLLGGYPGHDRMFVGMYPHMGFTAGPLMGRILADLVLGTASDRDLRPFDPTRFAQPA